MAFRLPSDSAPISPNHLSFVIPGQRNVSGDGQRETTHVICCLAAEFLFELYRQLTSECKKKRQKFIHLLNSEFKETLDILQEELLSVF